MRSLGANLKPSGRINTAPTLSPPRVPPAVICLTLKYRMEYLQLLQIQYQVKQLVEPQFQQAFVLSDSSHKRFFQLLHEGFGMLAVQKPGKHKKLWKKDCS